MHNSPKALEEPLFWFALKDLPSCCPNRSSAHTHNREINIKFWKLSIRFIVTDSYKWSSSKLDFSAQKTTYLIRPVYVVLICLWAAWLRIRLSRTPNISTLQWKVSILRSIVQATVEFAVAPADPSSHHDTLSIEFVLICSIHFLNFSLWTGGSLSGGLFSRRLMKSKRKPKKLPKITYFYYWPFGSCSIS